MEYKNEETDADDDKNNENKDKSENDEKKGDKKSINGDMEGEKGEGGIGLGGEGEGGNEGESSGSAEMVSDVNVKDVRRIKDLGLQALTSILQAKVTSFHFFLEILFCTFTLCFTFFLLIFHPHFKRR
jgi:hypothetical protein